MMLNLGSGQRPFPKPWINVDAQGRWNPDVVGDAAHLPQFVDGSADIIVAHHVLEHYGCGEADGLLKEAHRLLKTGGSLLIFVPDLKALAKRWLLGQIDDYTMFVNTCGAYMGDEADRHKWHYTAESLTEALQRAGKWSWIMRFDWRSIEGADLAKDWWVLAMEAVK